MAGIPNLTEKQIRDRTSPQSFAKGQSYHQGHAILDAVRRGNQIEGFCEGSQPSLYRILVVFDDNGIGSATCTCPYDWGGDCKHIVALLLTLIHNPESFEVRPPLADALQEHSKEELIALIHAMIERQPDLEMLIHRPIPGHRPRVTPVDTESYRKELRYAIRSYDGWDDRTPHQAVYSVARTAAEFGSHGDWLSARAIYSAILDECLGDEDIYAFDDEGDFSMALEEAINGLAECLEQSAIADDDTERRAALNSLLDIYIEDVNMGGIGLGDDVPDLIFEHARPTDIAAIRERVRLAQDAKGTSGYSRWGYEAFASFLVELDAIDNVDPEVVLERLREQGLYELVFKKLLQLERFDEAVAAAEEYLTDPSERFRAVTTLAEHGLGDAAIRLAEQALLAGHDFNLAHWLLDQYKERKDSKARLRLLQQCMERSPSLEYYVELETEAKASDQWQALRPSIIEALKAAQQHIVLARIFLHEQEWDLAWEVAESLSKAPSDNPLDRYYYPRLDLEVAQASRFARPHKAIPVYVEHARHKINHRDRRHYAEAAQYLSVVRQLYNEIGDKRAWDDLITDIREEFKRLPALLDELRRAGL